MCFPSVRLPAAAPASPDRRSPGAGPAAPAPGGRGERGQRRVGVWLSPGGAGLTRGCPPRGAGGRGEKLVLASA